MTDRRSVTMSRVALALGAAYVLLGISVAIAPEWFLSVVDWGLRSGLYVAALIRLVVGVVLILAAPASRFPTAFRVIGTLALIAGLVLPFVPIAFWAENMRWWTVGHVSLFRTVVAVGAILGGAFIVYAALPKLPQAHERSRVGCLHG